MKPVPSANPETAPTYRGRIAPTPTGYLHLGHAATFLRAQERARRHDGHLIFRMEDLDTTRCREEFARAALEDLAWLGLRWDEGPDLGGPCAPHAQSGRGALYLAAWQRLREEGFLFPCRRSRRDMREAPRAPHGEEALFPPAWRPPPELARAIESPGGWHWRFRVPDGREVVFIDENFGPFRAVAGVDFGDFPVWRRDGIPAYELAVVVDDAAMGITEVVRGSDLLLSTCRQILLYEALGFSPPKFFHTPLAVDAQGRRLAKRAGALALRSLRQAGFSAEEVRRWIGHPEEAPGFVRREFAGLQSVEISAPTP
jgi:glutamyl-tRNA synthetase